MLAWYCQPQMMRILSENFLMRLSCYEGKENS